MKKTGLLLIITLSLTALLTFAVFFSSDTVSAITESGFVVARDSQIEETLHQDNPGTRNLVEVDSNDVVYSSLTGYYLKSSRTQMDENFPVFLRGGAVLRFLDDESRLISDQLNVVTTYEGLYLADGITYDEDLTQVDFDDFILLKLNNGLYINAQDTVITTLTAEKKLSSNCIILFEEDRVRYYSIQNGQLVSDSVSVTMGSTIKIGDNEYIYENFAKALGLLSEALEKEEINENIDDEINAAYNVLNNNEEEESGWSRKSSDSEKTDVVDNENEVTEEKSEESEDTTSVKDKQDAGETETREEDKGEESEEKKESEGEASDEHVTDNPSEETGEKEEKKETDESSEEEKEESSGEKASDSENGDNTGDETGASEDENDKEAEDNQEDLDKKEDSGSGKKESEGGEKEGSSSSEKKKEGDEEQSSDTESQETEEDPEDPQDISGKDETDNETEDVYVAPKVSIGEFNTWCYAINGTIKIEDEWGAIVKGVTVTAYRGKKVVNGIEVGRSTLCRRTLFEDDEYNLYTLPPDSKIYIQYSYKYLKPTEVEVTEKLTNEDGTYQRDEKGNILTVTKTEIQYLRYTYYSEVYEVTTESLDSVKAVCIDLDEQFAAGSDSVRFNNLKISNTSDYDSQDGSFENFKLNTINYVNKLEFTLKDNSGNKVSLAAGSAVIRKALTEEGGTTFSASSSGIKSNTEYSYTVTVKDKYGNEIPSVTGGDTSRVIYTAKTEPEIALAEQENSMQVYVLSVTVDDPDSALKKENGQLQPVKLSIKYKDLQTNDTATEYVTGTVKYSEGGKEYEEDLELDENGFIVLDNPVDGKTYELTFDNLQFYTTYHVTPIVSYDLNPDGFNVLGINENVGLSEFKFYSADLASGNVGFDVGVPVVNDTSIRATFQMNDETTISILEMVDVYRFNIDTLYSSTAALLPETVDLSRDLLENIIIESGTGLYQYNNGYVDICYAKEAVYDENGKLVSKAYPHIYLYGTENQLIGKSVWDAMHITTEYDEDNGETLYIKQATLNFELPDDSLSTKTDYTIGVKAIVKKGTREYDDVGITLSVNKFRTRKVYPEFSDYTFFVVSGVAELQNFGVYDVDGTIIDAGGVIEFKLYYGDKLVKTDSIEATAYKSVGFSETIRFDNLIKGGDYTLEIEASIFNDTDYPSGKVVGKTLATIPFKAGEKLYAESMVMTNEASEQDGKQDVSINVEALDKDGALEGDENIYLTLKRSDSVKQPDYKDEIDIGDYGKIALTRNEDGHYVFDSDLAFTLDSGYAYKLTIVCYCNGTEFILDELEFSTDDDYIIVHNNKELVNAMKKYPDSYILVVEDFVHNESMGNTYFNGTIDFDGHTVTRDPKCYGYLIGALSDKAEVKNLEYVYPAGYTTPVGTNASPSIVGNSYGNINNIVVRIEGDMTINTPTDGKTYYIGLIAYANHENGVIENFAISIEGNVSFIKDANAGIMYFGLVAGYCDTKSAIRNGSIIAIDGAGVMFKIESKAYATTASIITPRIYSSEVKNILVACDIWFTEQQYISGYDQCAIVADTNYGRSSNILYVGDYYLCNEAGTFNRSFPVYSERMFVPNCLTVGPSWHITQSTQYANTTTGEVEYATLSQLNDASWFSEVLGDQFDIDDPVSNHYYPRVKLNDCVANKLDYVEMPKVSDDVLPSLVSDSFAEGDGYSHGNEQGDILLRFKNDKGIKITGLEIEGLTVESVTSIGKQEDGLYNVVAHVSVAQDSTINYVSEYKVKSFTYANGSKSVVSNCDYTTKNIVFYKEIATIQDWININGYSFYDKDQKKVTVSYTKTLKWNYKLVADLDFSKEYTAGKVAEPKQIVINGNTSTAYGWQYFEGYLDGGYYDDDGNLCMHKLSNITLNGLSGGTHYGLFPMVYKATIKNLVVENYSLTLSASATGGYRTGFIGYALVYASNTEALIFDNIHIIDSEVEGTYYSGCLVGQINGYGIVQNCSAQNSSLYDKANSNEGYYGGLVGISSYGSIVINSFVRDIDINVTHSTKVAGVGGVIGNGGFKQNIYATGKIVAVSDCVGGIEGNPSNVSLCCISYVDIEATGTGIYGLGGYKITPSTRCFERSIAIGDIIASGTASRTIPDVCAKTSTAMPVGTYAYAAQTVNSMTSADLGAAVALLTGDQLAQRSTWADTIQIGDEFDLDYVSQGYFPILYRTGSDQHLYGQEENLVEIPGIGGEQLLSVETARFEDGYYKVNAVVDHPGITHNEFVQIAQGGFLNIVADGMNLGLGDNMDYYIDGNEYVTLQTYMGEENKTLLMLSIPEENLTKRVDSYRLALQYTFTNKNNVTKTYKVQTVYSFDVTPAWRISNLEEWNYLMQRDDGIHRTLGENIIITGVIDFNGEDTLYRNLSFASLKGEASSSCLNPGFTNLKFYGVTGGFDCDPWISKVSGAIEDLTFSNMDIDYTGGDQTTRINAFFIDTCYGIFNCNFTDIDQKYDYHSGLIDGLIGYVNFEAVQNTVVDGLTLTSDSNKELVNVNAFVYSFTYVYDSVFKNITVNAATGRNISLFGRTGGSYLKADRNEYINITMNTSNTSGTATIFKGLSYMTMDKIYCDNINLTGVTYAAFNNNYISTTNIVIKNSSFTATTGTACAVCNSAICRDGYFCNNHIKGGTSAAGIAYSFGNGQNSKNVVVDCTVECTGYKDNTTLVGGMYCELAGILYDSVIRNTTVTGPSNVGGVAGKAAENGWSKTNSLYKVYVAEDVTVKATISDAGGIYGYVPTVVNIQDVICGADVQCEGVNAGGIIGEMDSAVKQMNIVGCTFAGSVYSNENAAGVIGYITGTSCKITTSTNNSKMNKVLVAADEISAQSGKVSAWVNSDSDQSIGDAGIYAYNRTAINGQSVESRNAADELTNSLVSVLPNSGTVVSDTDIATVSKYKTYAVENTSYYYFDTVTPVEGGNFTTYYPFYKMSSPSAQLTTWGYNYTNYMYSKTGESTKDCGIRIPVSAANPDGPYVYSSGLNTVNIELDTETVQTITVNGVSLTTNSRGIVSFNYDYVTDLSIVIGDKTYSYTADQLSNKSSLAGIYWYFIDPDDTYGQTVYLGDMTQNGGKPETDGVFEEIPLYDRDGEGFNNVLAEDEKIVHLWNESALTSKGYTVTFNGKSVIKSSATNISSLVNGVGTRSSTTAVSSYNMSVSDIIKYDVFVYDKETYLVKYVGNTASDSSYMNGQMYFVNSSFFTVNLYNNADINGTVLCCSKVTDNIAYMLTLRKDGTLVSYGANINTPLSFVNSGIVSVSMNVNRTDGSLFEYPVIIVEYKDGFLAFNYANGDELFDTRPASLKTAAWSLANLFVSPVQQISGAECAEQVIETYAALSEQEATAVSEEGTAYTLGEVLSSIAPCDDGSLARSQGGTGKGSADEAASDSSAVLEGLPKTVCAYNPQSGKYETYKTGDLVSTSTEKAASSSSSLEEQIESMEEIIEEERIAEAGAHKLNIAKLFSSFSSSEKVGGSLTVTVVFISISAFAAAWLLIRKKRR